MSGKTKWGDYEVLMKANAFKAKVVDQSGNQIGEVTLKMRSPLRPPQNIPDGYNPKRDCPNCGCDPPDPSMRR